jgi:tol-pal system protein YbgF
VFRGSAFAVALLALAGCVAAPEEDPMLRRVNDLDERVGRIDRIVANQSLVQLAQRVDQLQGDVRTLNGRIEELQNANEALRKQQRDLYADIDRRISSGAAAPQSAPPAAPATPGGDEQAAYDRAFDKLKSGDYPRAVLEFRQLAATYPSGALADNTQYWLGEAYYVTRDYDQAAAAFERVLAGWPNSRKAPDALLKLGYTRAEQKRWADARRTLEQVVTRHPGTDAARLATDRLAKFPADAR